MTGKSMIWILVVPDAAWVGSVVNAWIDLIAEHGYGRKRWHEVSTASAELGTQAPLPRRG